MKKELVSLLLAVCVVGPTFGQDAAHFQTRLQSLFHAGATIDSAQRVAAIDAAWQTLRSNHEIPLVGGDSVVFLYKGAATTVSWMGDFNGWGYLTKMDVKGKLIPGTNIWIWKTSFPRDTRLDYKILLNGQNWILDPENPRQQWSGVGGGSPNSQLQMPDWKEDPILIPRDNIEHGKVKEDILFDSKSLGYQIMYSVYTPSGNHSGKLPSLYVTDGYEYMLPKLGNMVTILDNLIADKKIKPLIVIFVDHREPVNRGNNKRMDELAMNPKYLDFFTAEFIPFIESHYPVLADHSERGIMGTSMGGLSAAYFAFAKPGVFGKAGIQSPAFKQKPQIYKVCETPDHPMKVSMTSGLISDASEASRKMKEIMEKTACDYHYREVNDGHSWGNWRNLIDDVLVDLYPN